MKILVLGAAGQVGGALLDALAPLGDIHAATRADLDITQSASIGRAVDALQPGLIVNAAAYTAVDQAESEVELAEAINGTAPGALANAAQACGALLIHYSTDYVFDGNKADPYDESDPTAPLSVYGRSKLHGEQAIFSVAADSIILRTTWVFAPHGKNFVKTILRLASEREQLRVINDQFGAPTSALHLARATRDIAQSALERRKSGTFASGLYHLTASGSTSWHGFAKEIVRQWRAKHGHASLRVNSIEPIATSEYPTAAARPKNSRLSNLKLQSDYLLTMPPWQIGLEECIANIPS